MYKCKYSFVSLHSKLKVNYAPKSVNFYTYARVTLKTNSNENKTKHCMHVASFQAQLLLHTKARAHKSQRHCISLLFVVRGTLYGLYKSM